MNMDSEMVKVAVQVVLVPAAYKIITLLQDMNTKLAVIIERVDQHESRINRLEDK